jgi:ATP adenylyltransferase
MKNLDAFGQAEYMELKKDPSDNLFTKIPIVEDEKSVLLLKKSKFCYIILNKFPYNAGYLQVIPFREVNSMD